MILSVTSSQHCRNCFTGVCYGLLQLLLCKSDSHLPMITAVDRAQSFADSLFLISNYPEKRRGETQTLRRTRLQPVFLLSKILSGQAKVVAVHWGPQHQLALIFPCCPDVGIRLCIGPYGSTYSPGEENKWFVFLLWPLSLRTYKSSFWRLETCAWVEPDLSWHVSLECVAFRFKLILLGSLLYQQEHRLVSVQYSTESIHSFTLNCVGSAV